MNITILLNKCIFLIYVYVFIIQIVHMKSINDSQTGENQLCRLEEQLSVYRKIKSKTYHTLRTVLKSIE
jgi:hypothetical protein